MNGLLSVLILLVCSSEIRGFSARSLIGLLNSKEHRSFDRITSPDELTQYGINPEKVDPSILEDATATTPELIEKYGYPVEIHRVKTPDGYLLEMHRIPKPGGVPIYLQHGIIDSSAAWVIMGPQSALAYQLSDLGYDVWLGNNRGNRYSRSHVRLDPKKKEFWDFSFHELGVFDLPAMIDYILEETHFSQIHYIGHSQGTTAFWAMCSERPVYCSTKIISMTALAPVAFMQHTKSPVIRAMIPFLNQLETLFKILGVYEFLPNNDLLVLTGQMLCKKEDVTQALCMNAIFLITGYNSEQLNKTMLPAILGHVPNGAATKQLVHYGQLIKSGKFRQFDYGWIKNVLKYGSVHPPEYDLREVKVPVSLYHSLNDWLAQPKDVERLASGLPNLRKKYLVPMPKFNHLDFIFAKKCREMVNDEIVEDLEENRNEIEYPYYLLE